MAAETYIAQLKSRLAEVDARIAEAEQALPGGDPVAARRVVDRLAHLRLRHDTLVNRIADAAAADADGWSTLHASIRAELDGLVDTLDDLLTRTS